jgi:hypothetical protein
MFPMRRPARFRRLLSAFICVICGQLIADVLAPRYAEGQSLPTTSSQPATIDSLLRSVGIEPRDVGLRADNLALLVGRGRTPELAHLLMCAPRRADLFGRVIGTEFTAAAREEPAEVLAAMSRLNGRLVRRGLVDDPLEKFKAKAADADGRRAVLRKFGLGDAGIAALPESVQEAATLLLLAEREAQAWVRRADDEPRTGGEWDKLAARLLEKPKTGAEEAEQAKERVDPDFDLALKRWVEDFRTESVMIAAQDLLLAVEYVRPKLLADASLATAKFHVEFESDLGRVVLADSRNDTHDYAKPAALIIDIGGDDHYANAGAGLPGGPCIGICFDLAGNDTYDAGPDSTGSFGVGLFGVGILWDEAGNDTYRGGKLSQGVANFGVGILIDNAGDDVYAALDESQAAATAGYGLLLDRGGNDRYESYRGSQAFAGPNAVAMLIDLAGNDRYIANDTDIRYPSAQNPQHNDSLGQGCATGWRADFSDGVSVAGGVAVLLDAAGDDEYTCGLFGQGAGYWYGLGMLIDQGGDDRYTGHWYVQGAAAHFAAGMLFDRGGNDRYTANQNMSQGAGHDLSVGVLIDDAGDDVYLGSTLGLGASNAAGVGLFVDKAGDDEYRTPPESCLGWVNPERGYRGLFASYGLFFDLGGTDKYLGRQEGQPGRAGAGEGRTWKTPPDKDALGPFIFGYGFDR